MPWDQQLLNIRNLQVTQEEQKLAINSLRYTDVLQKNTNSRLSVDISNNSNNNYLLSNLVGRNHAYSKGNITNLFSEVYKYLIGAFLILYSIMTINYMKYFNDEISYYTKAVKDSPSSAYATKMLGVRLVYKSKEEEAIPSIVVLTTH